MKGTKDHLKDALAFAFSENTCDERIKQVLSNDILYLTNLMNDSKGEECRKSLRLGETKAYGRDFWVKYLEKLLERNDIIYGVEEKVVPALELEIDEASVVQESSAQVMNSSSKDSNSNETSLGVHNSELRHRFRKGKTSTKEFESVAKLERKKQEQFESDVSDLIQQFKNRMNAVSESIKEDNIAIDDIEDKISTNLSKTRTVNSSIRIAISQTTAKFKDYILLIILFVATIVCLKFLPKLG